MSLPHLPDGSVLPDSTLLFCDGPVWIGVRVDGVDGEAILAALSRLSAYVRVAAEHSPRGAPSACARPRGCACIMDPHQWATRKLCPHWGSRP